MSLYNEAGRRRTRLTAGFVLAALVLGAVAGFVVGRSSAGDPSAGDVVARLREALAPVRSGLELIPTEYSQVRGGAAGESAAVRGALDRIRSGLGAARADLRALDPSGLQELEAAVGQLEAAVGGSEPAADVERLAGEAAAALRRVPGGS